MSRFYAAPDPRICQSSLYPILPSTVRDARYTSDARFVNVKPPWFLLPHRAPFLQSQSSVIQYTTGNSFPFSVRPIQWHFFFAAVRLIPLKTVLSISGMGGIHSLGGQMLRPQPDRSGLLSGHRSSCLGLHDC